MVSKGQIVGGSWVQILSETRIFFRVFVSPLFTFVVVVCLLVHSLWRLVGRISICLNVTVRCC